MELPSGGIAFHGIALAISYQLQDKPRKFSGVFTKAFPQPPCLEQSTERQIDLLFWVLKTPSYFTGLGPVPKPPKIKYVTDTNKIYVILLFSNNLLVCNLKIFIFM